MKWVDLRVDTALTLSYMPEIDKLHEKININLYIPQIVCVAHYHMLCWNCLLTQLASQWKCCLSIISKTGTYRCLFVVSFSLFSVIVPCANFIVFKKRVLIWGNFSPRWDSKIAGNVWSGQSSTFSVFCLHFSEFHDCLSSLLILYSGFGANFFGKKKRKRGE